MRHYKIGHGKWVFVDWMGIDPGYGHDLPVKAVGDDIFVRHEVRRKDKKKNEICLPHGIELKTHPPQVIPEKIICADQEWEKGGLNSYATFLQDRGRYRAWYQCTNQDGTRNTGYAESDDGIQWNKQGIVNDLHGATTVFIDPSASKDERYKAVGGRWGFVSRDGLNWKTVGEIFAGAQSDTQVACLYDLEAKTYVLYTRQWDNMMQRRGVNRSKSKDFETFPRPDPILESNPLDPPDWDIYCSGYHRWPGAVDAHLMMLNIYKHTRDENEAHLATSRDGIVWHRHLGRTPWIDGVPTKLECYPSCYTCAGILETNPKQWSIYLAISSKGHNEPEKSGPEADRGIYRAVLRKDGFMSLSSYGHGSFWTVPFVLESEIITCNVKTRHGGFLKCEIAEAGKGVPGTEAWVGEAYPYFSLSECNPIAGDHVNIPITWRNKVNLNELRSQTVRLKVEMYKADLFAISFL